MLHYIYNVWENKKFAKIYFTKYVFVMNLSKFNPIKISLYAVFKHEKCYVQIFVIAYIMMSNLTEFM